MSQSEVYRPSDGSDLQIRHPLVGGYPSPTDAFRKSRPSTTQSGGYRFGRLSHNSFFTRHNPHPDRVRHMKGLLDIPICTVNDDGYFANARYSLQFPPNNFNEHRLNNRGRIPVNALNVNSQLHPINTITGLQYFTNLQNYPFREKAIPKVGLVPVTEAWWDELKSLTNKLDDEKPKEAKTVDGRPKTKYSAETGRIIPPPSRALSRHASRRSTRDGRDQGYGNFQHIMADPDKENMVLVMLAQILQTEDINAVKAWLVSAPESDKALAMELINASIAGRDEFYNQNDTMYRPDNNEQFKLPPINESNVVYQMQQQQQQDEQNPGQQHSVDRLVVNEQPAQSLDSRFTRAPTPPSNTDNLQKPMIVDNDYMVQAPTYEAFKPKSPGPKRQPTTSQSRGPSRAQQKPAPVEQADPTLRYTNTPKAPAENTDSYTCTPNELRRSWQPLEPINSPNTF